MRKDASAGSLFLRRFGGLPGTFCLVAIDAGGASVLEAGIEKAYREGKISDSASVWARFSSLAGETEENSDL